jgi:DNA repair protein RAD50
MQAEIDEYRAQLADIKRQFETESRQRQDNEQRLAEANHLETDIEANIEYRRRKKALGKRKVGLEAKRATLLTLTEGDDVGGDIVGFEKDLKSLDTAKSEMRGALLTEQNQATQYRQQLESERYHNIDLRHRNKLIEVRTMTMALKDLDTYGKALDEALMQFHLIKMKEINRVLKDYWRVTYRGKDIDEVYIQSECVETTTGKRNYNYQVMMKSGDTELPMRGRCSAGQRVLASLVMRLALAETFCIQCGILALDEPTTNLDEANIKSFAKALNAIIEKRREQENFQLILITHDDAFVDLIGKRSYADHYYRVFKDINQNSKIRKQELHEG